MSVLSTMLLAASLVFVNSPNIPIPKEKPSVCNTETDVEIIQLSMKNGLDLIIFDKQDDVVNFVRAIKYLENLDTEPEDAERLAKIIMIMLPDRVLASGVDNTGCEILVGTFSFETAINIINFIGDKT